MLLYFVQGPPGNIGSPGASGVPGQLVSMLHKGPSQVLVWQHCPPLILHRESKERKVPQVFLDSKALR